MEFLCTMNDTKKFSSVFIPVLYSIIAATGIIGNGLVVVTYSFYKKVKSMTDMYLMNLAIADILFVVTLPFRAASEARSWIFEEIGCKVLEGMYSINFYSGMLFLAVIGIDRYIAIVHATKSFNYRGKALVYSKIICMVIWLSGIVVSLPTFIFSTMYKFETTGEMVCAVRYPRSYSSIDDKFKIIWQIIIKKHEPQDMKENLFFNVFALILYSVTILDLKMHVNSVDAIIMYSV
uniref:C-C chemokine receptor type 6-like n=1 Tax=Pristiophorus japonicus TaxID=55135 RepID=UPI00398F759C